MTVALITSDKKTVLQTFPGVPDALRLPNGDVVQGAAIGWTGEGYSLVSVPPFTIPTGQQATGEPSYSFDANGNVIETYATQAIPGPAPLPQVQVNSTATPAISGSYAFDATTQAKLLAVTLYIEQNGRFPDSMSPFPWPDAAGMMHMFATTAQFQSLATALADYVTALTLGQTPAVPLSIP